MKSEVVADTRGEIEKRSADGRVATLLITGPRPVAAQRWTTGVTVADGLMVVIGLVAAVARLANLGALPLSPGEADAALSSWQFARGVPLTAPPVSPAYFSFTSLLMSLGGDGDAVARLVPALFGLLTVLLPWLWRGRFRPAVWLTAGVLLAVSPIHMIISRTAGGEAIALFALTLLAVAATRLDEGDGWGMAAGAALGLGLTSAPLFYSGLVAFLPAWWVFRGAAGLGGASVRGAALAAVIVFLTIAAGGLFYPQGIGAALGLLAAWLGQFGLVPNATADPLLALLRYEPALLLLGLPAVAWALLRDSRLGKQMALWLGLLLALLLLQAGAPQQAAAALIPGALLIGLLAGDLLAAPLPAGAPARDERRRMWLVIGGLLLLGMTLLVSLARFTKLGLWTGAQAPLIGLAVLAFVFAGIVVIFALAWENSAARRGAFLGLAALLLYFQWGTGWHLSQQAANDPGQRWVTAGTDDDVPVLVNLLGRVSRQATNADSDLDVFSTVDSPVLRWYFRNFARFTTGATLPVDTAAAVVVTADDAQPQLPNDYFGDDFGLEQRDAATDDRLAGQGLAVAAGEALRDWLFHESNTPVEHQRVIIWIRADLATAE